MNGKALMLLGMAAACGLAAMFGVRTLLNRKQTSEVPMSAVLVAIQEIKVEQLITPEMISTKEFPADMVPPGALTDPKQALSRWAMIRILPGDVILDGKLAQKGTPTGMIARITPGMRAFAIRVDEQSGVSGFILPDYRVDVLQPRPDQPGHADMVLENVRVLASGTVFERIEERSIEANTVTLEVTPEQVRTLASAMQRGSLTLSLRGLNDTAIAEPVEVITPDTEPTPEPTSAPVLLREVLVANRSVGPDEVLTDDVLTLRALPVGTLPPDASADASRFVGREVISPLAEGEAISQVMLGKRIADRLSQRVEPGYRAVSLRIDEQSGISGHIVPGDYVDIFAIAKDTESEAARVLVHAVPVLASGLSTEEGNPEATTVTVKVTPDDASRLASAMKDGSISLALRGPEDREIPIAEETVGSRTGTQLLVFAQRGGPIVYPIGLQPQQNAASLPVGELMRFSIIRDIINGGDTREAE